MNQFLSYLSGNVPGGFPLLLVILLTTFLILYFMHRVNELFSRGQMIRWMALAGFVLILIYAGLWLKNPPHYTLKRYTVIIVAEQGDQSGFAEHLTDLLSRQIKPHISGKEFFFDPGWFYAITPVDSAISAAFRERVARQAPLHKVLRGKISRSQRKFTVSMELVRFPSRQILRQAQQDFPRHHLKEFVQWVRSEFGSEIPFHQPAADQQWAAADSILEKARRYFYRREYAKCRQLLRDHHHTIQNDPRRDIWLQMAEIRLAGETRRQAPPPNPYSPILSDWQHQLRDARNRLLDYLRLGFEDPMIDNLVGESYLLEEDFATAEIYLEKACTENPFDIDVLLNLSFLHASRYREFGFKGVQDIYRQIIDISPIAEGVLLQWSDKILLRNPGFSAPPQYARERVQRYLDMNPHSYPAWLMLGKIEAQGFKREEALRAYLRADSIAPRNGIVQYNLGALYYEWNKKDLAKPYFEKSIAYSNYLDAHLYLGAILRDEGKYEEALEKFRYRVSHKQDDDDFYAYQAMKGIQECLEALERSQTVPE